MIHPPNKTFSASESSESSGDHFTHDLAAFGPRQTVITSGVAICQFVGRQPQEVQHGGVQVAEVDPAFDGLVAALVRFAVDVSTLDASAGEPERETAMVVAGLVLAVVCGASANNPAIVDRAR